jgi:hypothetical protein
MGRPQFDEVFEPNRVAVGESIPSAELGRRLCHELQIPQKFSTRIYKAISRVIGDAVRNGEGVRIQDLGVLKLKPFKSPTVKLANGRVVPRPSMFKIIFDTTEKGDDLLQQITKDNYES